MSTVAISILSKGGTLKCNINGGSVRSIKLDGFSNSTVNISGGTVDSLYTYLPELTISGGVIGDMEAHAIYGALTITGGTFLTDVDIFSEFNGYIVAISGGLFSGDINLISVGPTFLVFYGDLKLDLLSERIENDSWTIAEYYITGTLGDGSPLSTHIHSSSTYYPDQKPDPWVSITMEPWQGL